MNKTIKNVKGIEAKIFATTFEYEAYGQVKKLVNFEPYQESKVRIMPDAHAGRLMSRSKAKQILDVEDFEESMSGIYSTSIGQSTLDEAPLAYKTIEEIREAITGTVDIIDELKPIYNYKSH